jgi:hypothetical protein
MSTPKRIRLKTVLLDGTLEVLGRSTALRILLDKSRKEEGHGFKRPDLSRRVLDVEDNVSDHRRLKFSHPEP